MVEKGPVEVHGLPGLKIESRGTQDLWLVETSLAGIVVPTHRARSDRWMGHGFISRWSAKPVDD